jgi:uncharacterized protein YegJ (DUF2314 family)
MPETAAPPAAHAPEATSPWKSLSSSTQVGVIDESADAELQAAMARARETAGDARARWAAADPDARARWSIKWAAPTEDGHREHVWVTPLVWGPHRIEGVLTSTPTRLLLGAYTEGDYVGFSSGELSDWLYDPGSASASREGGFTVQVLERRFGRPPESP